VDTQEGRLQLLEPPSSQADELQADNLQGSGIDTVLMTSLYAIVGAVALERGGEIANKVVQEKILAPLGFSFSPES
jgi:large subunit ribosomal protein L15